MPRGRGGSVNGRDAGAAKRKDGQHIRLYHAMLDSHAWHALSPTEIAVFLAMRRQLNGSNNGRIDATLTTMRRWGVKSPTTLAKSLRALVAVGFIENLRPGRLTQGGKMPGLFRFTDIDTPPDRRRDVMQAGGKATNEWRRWKSASEADAAVVKANSQAAEPASNGTLKLQKMESSAPDSGVVRSIKWSKPASHGPETGACQGVAIACKAAPALDFPPWDADGAVAVGKLQKMESLYKLPGGCAPKRSRLGRLMTIRIGDRAAGLLSRSRPEARQQQLVRDIAAREAAA